MVLTNAERQKKYRERMRMQNPAKYQAMKTKNAERNKKRKKIKECSKEVIELKRKKWRASQNRHRTKTKDTTPNYDSDTNTDQEVNGTEIDAKISIERNRLKTKWAAQKKTYEETIKKMIIDMQNLKKKCKRYMQKNKQLIGVIDELKLKASEPHVTIQDENEVIISSESRANIQVENEMTPLSKSHSFIEQHLPNISEEEKEKVKKQLVTHNVLVNAIQDTYAETKKNDERHILKKILEKEVMKKYNRKSEITKSVFGLNGRARQRKDIIRKNNIIINEIKEFYNRDDVSRPTAGKKEFKTKSKIKTQRRYLLNTLKELYKKYRAEGGRAKKTSFQKYKPFYVMAPKLSNRETCGCVKHENCIMKIKKLHSLGTIETTDLNEILSEVVCDLNSKECAYGECSTCNNKSLKFNGDTFHMDEIVTWNEFAMQTHEYINKNDGKTMSTKKMTKKQVQGKLKSLVKLLNEELKMMRKHVFNIKHQYSQYLSCIKNLKSTEVVIHIDFSENYVCKLATEVQSMHFGASKSQVTIHTGVLYVAGKPQSFASISPSSEHGPEAIWAHLKPIINFVRNEVPLANAIHFFSDGPATQYKQKKNFYLFMKQTKAMGFHHSTWNFSESAHGKGAADGVGGGLKRRLDGFVKHGIDIPDAYTAYTLLKNSDTSVMTFYIQEDDIAEYCIEDDLTPVPQTMNIHQITNSEITNVLRFRCLSCFCGDSHRGFCECFDVKTQQLVKACARNNKNIANKPNLNRKTIEDGETNQEGIGKKEEKVTVLSEVRYTAQNMAYGNLQNFPPFRLKRIRKLDADYLFSTKNSYKENLNYDKSVPSTSKAGIKPYKRATGKKQRPNPGDSSTDDDQYSLHDSSREDFYEEPDNEEEMEESNENDTEIMIKKNGYDNNETVKENLEKNDYTSTAGGLAYKIEKNANVETVTENVENNDCTTTAGMGDNTSEVEINSETKGIPNYNFNDSVIVRYYLKNGWKYYVGFVENIANKENDIFYTIRFLKPIKKPTLKFIAARKVDRDVVPDICIVRKIELEFDSKAYIMKDDDCMVYFE